MVNLGTPPPLAPRADFVSSCVGILLDPGPLAGCQKQKNHFQPPQHQLYTHTFYFSYMLVMLDCSFSSTHGFYGHVTKMSQMITNGPRPIKILELCYRTRGTLGEYGPTSICQAQMGPASNMVGPDVPKQPYNRPRWIALKPHTRNC